MLTERTTTLFVSIFYFQKCQTRDFSIFMRRCIWENTCSFPKESPYIFLNPFETVAK